METLWNLVKINNKDTRKTSITFCSVILLSHSVFIVNFEQFSHYILMLTSNKQIPAGIYIQYLIPESTEGLITLFGIKMLKRSPHHIEGTRMIIQKYDLFHFDID